MKDSELIAIIDHEIRNSLGKDDQLSKDRAEAFQYYLGEKVGKLAPSELTDSSQVVSRDVMDTIEWIMPSLMRIFTGGDSVVTFEPVGLEDEEKAKQATEWTNYVFMKQNPGFILLHNLFKDALLQKLGIVKTWWDESEDVTKEEYKGVTLEEVTMMMQDGGVELLEQSQREDGMLDITVKRTRKKRQICIENVPPEEFLFNRDARSAADIKSCHHRLKRTVSELKAAGYKNANELDSDDCGADFADESTVRNNDYDSSDWGEDSMDKTMRIVRVTESYIQVDYNGDGIAEWRKVLKSGKVILDNQECDSHPFDIITPILIPHRLVGMSVADMVMDLQEIKTVFLREMINNMRYMNAPQVYVDENKSVDIDALLDRRIGGVVRGRGENGVQMMPVAPMSPLNFNMMEYVDSIRENRTGVTRYNQGLDANSLNKTATGINAIMGAAQQRIELIARVFAETGVKDLFKRILKLSIKYENKGRIFRLRNQYVQIDPRSWSTEYDVTVSVGVGTGNKEQVAAHLTNIMAIQEKMLQLGLPTVDPKRIYNAAKRLTESIGFKDGDLFFVDPEGEKSQQQNKQKNQEEQIQKELMLRSAIAEIAAKEAEAQKKGAEAQKAMSEIGMTEQPEDKSLDLAQIEKELIINDRELALRDRELSIKEHEIVANDQLEREKIQAEIVKAVISKQDNAAAGASTADISQVIAQAFEKTAAVQQQSTELIVSALQRPKVVMRDEQGEIIGVN